MFVEMLWDCVTDRKLKCQLIDKVVIRAVGKMVEWDDDGAQFGR